MTNTTEQPAASRYYAVIADGGIYVEGPRCTTRAQAEAWAESPEHTDGDCDCYDCHDTRVTIVTE